jgi:hypothetical protein
MTALIDRVRLMVNDPAGDSQTFSDLEIQDFLDRTRLSIRYLELEAAPDYRPSTVEYIEYHADRGDWEADVLLQDGTYSEITPAEMDLQVGMFRFAASQNPPVMLTGKVYDVYAAAVMVLEAWQAKVALDYNFSAAGQSFQRSQKMAQLAQLADTYRKQIRGTRGGMTVLRRSDME